MQQRCGCSLLVLAAVLQPATALVVSLNATSHTPITERVTIEGAEVYGQSAGFGDVNVCKSFAGAMVSDDSKPTVTVCGTGTKITIYLLNRCDTYDKYQEFGGVCNGAADSGTCETVSPATQYWLATAQSYKITQC